MEEKSLILKQPQFSLGSVSNGFSATESIKVSINGNVYELSVDYNSIEY